MVRGMRDSEKREKQEREQLRKFLERHGFPDVHTPACDSHRTIRFEPLYPLQVAQEAGNTEMINILVDAGARLPKHARVCKEDTGLSLSTGFRRLVSLMSSKSSGSLEEEAEPEEATPLRSCLKPQSRNTDTDESDEDVLTAYV